MTDGVAIVNTNNVAPLLKRVVDDMSSYYLLTYSSTNSKLDGKFRSINVRLSRAGRADAVPARLPRPDRRRRFRRRSSGAVPPGHAAGAERGARGAQRDGVQPARRAAAARVGLRAAGRGGAGRVLAGRYARRCGTAPSRVGQGRHGGRRGARRRRPHRADVDGPDCRGRRICGGRCPRRAGSCLATTRFACGRRAARARPSTRPRASPSRPRPPAIGDAVVWRRRPATGLVYFRTADPRASRTDRLRFELASAGDGDAVGHAPRSRGQSDVGAAAGEHARRRRHCTGSWWTRRSRRSRRRLRGGSEGWRRDAHHCLPRRSVGWASGPPLSSLPAVRPSRSRPPRWAPRPPARRSPSCSRTAVKISGGASAGRPGVLSGDQRRSMR